MGRAGWVLLSPQKLPGHRAGHGRGMNHSGMLRDGLSHSFVLIAAWKLKSVIKAPISINELLGLSSQGSSQVKAVLAAVVI